MVEFKCFIDLSDINDSMELDSGSVVAELREDKYMLELRVCGEVRVDFGDDRYTCASNMPDELLQIIHDGKLFEFEDDRIEVIDNNWFELFLYEWKDDMWVWTGSSDLWDCEGYSADELKVEMENILDEWKEIK